jgi:hypothetical protein
LVAISNGVIQMSMKSFLHPFWWMWHTCQGGCRHDVGRKSHITLILTTLIFTWWNIGISIIVFLPWDIL